MAPIETIPTTTASTIYCPIIWDYTCDRCPTENLTRDQIISCIASGEWDSLLKVVASDQSTGKCWDATQEIARAALEQAIDRHGSDSVPRNCLAFAEDVLGLNSTRAFLRPAA